MISSKFFLLSKKTHLNSGVRLLFHLLNYFCEITSNSDIHIGRIDGFGEKKARIDGFACPYSPLLTEHKLFEKGVFVRRDANDVFVIVFLSSY